MTTIDPNANPAPVVTTSALEQLVGPDKKFADNEALAKGKLAADAYVRKLEDETKSLRDLIRQGDQKIATLEARVSILDRLEPNPSAPTSAPVAQPQAQPVVQGLTEDGVLSVIEARDAKRAAEQNKREVDAVLIKQLGANAQSFLLQKASDLGMNPEDLYKLAVTSPKAFYNTVGLNPNQSDNASLHRDGRPATYQPNKEIRNKSWWDKKRDEMGVKKFITNAKLQNDMHKDMQALGDAFFE